MRHLWEVDHPYYCNLGNYFNNDCGHTYKSWAEFMEEMGDIDMDYNLLFRFDWKEGEDNGASTYKGDDYYRNGHLEMFWMGQRKGKYQYSVIDVCRADEPAVLEYLKPRWEYMRALWAPLSDEQITARESGE